MLAIASLAFAGPVDAQQEPNWLPGTDWAAEASRSRVRMAPRVPAQSAWRTTVIPALLEPDTTPVQRAARAAPTTKPLPLTGYAHELNGVASYYWQEQGTASGERFDRRAMTAAHKTLPLGTRVRVTNLMNGKSTIVRINDRGPFKAGRVIDLSEAAAEVLAMTSAGLAPVMLEVVR